MTRTKYSTGLAAPATTAVALAAPSLSAAKSEIVNPDGLGSVPWQALVMVDLGDGTAIQCGGTIRDETHVVTAAHCLVDGNGQPVGTQITVEAGVTDLANPGATAQIRDASDAQTFPDYDPQTHDGDAALLTLDKALDLSDPATADSLPLVAPNDESATQAVVSGWGASAEGGDTVDQLTYATLDVFDASGCATYGAGFNATTMLCAGRQLPDGEMVDSCQGDSGGPLARQVGDGTADALIGIVSWGKGCAEP